jgi:hypothetical protein
MAELLTKGIRLKAGEKCEVFGLRRCPVAKCEVLHDAFDSRRNRLEPPCTDPYARWCGRGRWVTAAPVPINDVF